MDELTKNEELGDLYAYYGSLLTKGQQSYFEDYYYNDLSLVDYPNIHFVGDSLSSRGIAVSAAQGAYSVNNLLKNGKVKDK